MRINKQVNVIQPVKITIHTHLRILASGFHYHLHHGHRWKKILHLSEHLSLYYSPFSLTNALRLALQSQLDEP